MAEMTARQAAAWPEAVARVRKHAGYDAIPDDMGSWDVAYSEETRPGRGHAINATHADSNEECDCEPCVAEREDENS